MFAVIFITYVMKNRSWQAGAIGEFVPAPRDEAMQVLSRPFFRRRAGS